jgi:hypothetical protein
MVSESCTLWVYIAWSSVQCENAGEQDQFFHLGNTPSTEVFILKKAKTASDKELYCLKHGAVKRQVTSNVKRPVGIEN